MKNQLRPVRTVLAVVAVLAMLTATSAVAADVSASDRQTVSWWWDDSSAVGRSNLVRTASHINSAMQVRDLTPGDVATLWLIVFNNPDGCSTSPCSVPADVFNPAAEADFFWAAGKVVNPKGRVTLTGTLSVGQTAHSGKVEIGAGDAVPFSNPLGAEVVVAVHSHGPAATGAELDAQLSSHLGGCTVFNGPDGFAAGPEGIPDAPGECSTLLAATHN